MSSAISQKSEEDTFLLSSFRSMTDGQKNKEQLLQDHYEKLKRSAGELVLIEERYTEHRYLSIGSDDENHIVHVSLGKIAAPYLRPAPLSWPQEVRNLDTHIFSGNGDLEIVTQKSIWLVGHWYVRAEGTYCLREILKRKVPQINIPSEALLCEKPFTRYYKYDAGCTQMINGVDVTVDDLTIHIGEEIDALFKKRKIMLEENLKIIEHESDKVLGLLKQKLQ